MGQKKCAEAEVTLKECLAIRQKTQPEDWRTFNTQSVLGEALLGQKKCAQAEPLLVQGYEGLAKRADKMPPQVRTVRLKEALNRLVRLCDATGNKDGAAKWRKKLDELKEAGPAKPPPKH